jgi:hypothetical protein
MTAIQEPKLPKTVAFAAWLYVVYGLLVPLCILLGTGPSDSFVEAILWLIVVAYFLFLARSIYKACRWARWWILAITALALLSVPFVGLKVPSGAELAVFVCQCALGLGVPILLLLPASGRWFRPNNSLSRNRFAVRLNSGVRPHMKLAARFASILYATFSLSGCNAEYEDVSAIPEHRRVIGELCQVLSPLNAHGVTSNVERHRRTDLIALTTLNLSGPEITFSTRLLPGTILEILAVRKCKNCPFDDRTQYRVRSQPMPIEFGNVPVYMDLQRVTPDAIACKTLRGERSAV